MVICNTTISIDSSIQDEWTQWMKTTYIPLILDTGKFVDPPASRFVSEFGRLSLDVFDGSSIDTLLQEIRPGDRCHWDERLHGGLRFRRSLEQGRQE